MTTLTRGRMFLACRLTGHQAKRTLSALRVMVFGSRGSDAVQPPHAKRA